MHESSQYKHWTGIACSRSSNMNQFNSNEIASNSLAHLLWCYWELPFSFPLIERNGLKLFLPTKKVYFWSPRGAQAEDIEIPPLSTKFSTEQIISHLCLTVYDLHLFAEKGSNTPPPTNIISAALWWKTINLRRRHIKILQILLQHRAIKFLQILSSHQRIEQSGSRRDYFFPWLSIFCCDKKHNVLTDNNDLCSTWMYICQSLWSVVYGSFIYYGPNLM